MPQPTGFPGGGLRLSSGCAIFSGVGDPNTSTTPDVIAAGLGSLFLRTDAPSSVTALYVCTTAGIKPTPTQAQVAAAWTAK